MSDNRHIYLHIGYHKTATSLLQKRVFPKLSTGLLVHPEVGSTAYYNSFTPDRHPNKNSIRLVRLFNLSPEIWKSKMGNKVIRDLWQSNQETGKLIISDEDLLGDIRRPSKFVPTDTITDLFRAKHVSRWLPLSGSSKRISEVQLFCHHLEQFAEVATSNGIDSVRVIVGLRRQDEYLASFYAQESNRIWNASQSDFEEWIFNILTPSLDYYDRGGLLIDYYYTIKKLKSTIGENNVFVFTQESLSGEPHKFVNNLLSYTGLKEKSDYSRVVSELSSKKHKSNKAKPHQWSLKKFRSLLLKKKYDNGTIRKVLNNTRIPTNLFDWSREDKINIHDDLRKFILSNYSRSNSQLDDIITSVNLAQYNYY